MFELWADGIFGKGVGSADPVRPKFDQAWIVKSFLLSE